MNDPKIYILSNGMQVIAGEHEGRWTYPMQCFKTTPQEQVDNMVNGKMVKAKPPYMFGEYAHFGDPASVKIPENAVNDYEAWPMVLEFYKEMLKQLKKKLGKITVEPANAIDQIAGKVTLH